MHLTKGMVVVITGASRGIGRETAIEFARYGCRVVLAGRDQARLEDVAHMVRQGGGEALSCPTDVSDESQCRQLISKAVATFGGVDILVNNAGYGHYSSVEHLSTSALEEIFKTNLYGTLWCTQAALPHMRKRGRGHIVNVSTIISQRSFPFMSAYCMSKFAMNALDEALRLEVRKDGIGVSLVCPGFTKTDFQTNAKKVGYRPPVGNERGMSAHVVAHKIVQCVRHNRRRVYLTAGGKFLLLLQRISPAFCDELIYFLYFKFAPRYLGSTVPSPPVQSTDRSSDG